MNLPFDLAEARSVLARTPSVVRAMVTGLPDKWAKAHYGPDTWTPREIVGHLIFGEMTDWIPRARHILKHADTRPFAPFDRTGHRSIVANRTIESLAEEFAIRREERLRELDAIDLDDTLLDIPGLHPALGPVTLRQLIAAWAVHDLNHIAQLAKALAFQYQEHVGPWEAYLSILAPPNPR